uniref:No apical meristem-associated C-terminal domain-containing protein n=1 Tax=Arundo donax TaxID=35708 RepID=A0A0A8XVE6_ARUDO
MVVGAHGDQESEMALEEERLRLQAEGTMAKKEEQDNKIMFMDTTHLDDQQKTYVEALRGQILASLFSTGGGGSRSGSGNM